MHVRPAALRGRGLRRPGQGCHQGGHGRSVGRSDHRRVNGVRRAAELSTSEGGAHDSAAAAVQRAAAEHVVTRPGEAVYVRQPPAGPTDTGLRPVVTRQGEQVTGGCDHELSVRADQPYRQSIVRDRS